MSRIVRKRNPHGLLALAFLRWWLGRPRFPAQGVRTATPSAVHTGMERAIVSNVGPGNAAASGSPLCICADSSSRGGSRNAVRPILERGLRQSCRTTRYDWAWHRNPCCWALLRLPGTRIRGRAWIPAYSDEGRKAPAIWDRTYHLPSRKFPTALSVPLRTKWLCEPRGLPPLRFWKDV